MTHSENLDLPFKDGEVRRAWLEFLEFTTDDALTPYAEWIEAELDIAFDTLLEEGLEFVSTYVTWCKQLRAEQAFLRRRKLAGKEGRP